MPPGCGYPTVRRARAVSRACEPLGGRPGWWRLHLHMNRNRDVRRIAAPGAGAVAPDTISFMSLHRLAWVFSGALLVHAERLPIRTYTSADGLPSDTIRRIRSDSRGYLWFCTDEGVGRFDGSRFVT